MRRKLPYLSKGRSPDARRGMEQYNASFILETGASKQADPGKRAEILEAAAEMAYRAYESSVHRRTRSDARGRAVRLYLEAASGFVHRFDMFRARYDVEMAALAAANKAEANATAAALRRLADIELERVPPVMDPAVFSKLHRGRPKPGRFTK